MPTHEGKFDFEVAQPILRSHEGGVCMYDEFETRGSQISILSDKGNEHLFIQTPFPCQQEYKLSQFP